MKNLLQISLISISLISSCMTSRKTMSISTGYTETQKLSVAQPSVINVIAPRMSMDTLYEQQNSVASLENTEQYAHITENGFKRTTETPLSTFSIDVDGASFSNCRRFLLNEQRLPPIGAVRLEEFINYFSYNYPSPTEPAPFSIVTGVDSCPWNKNNLLVQVALQGKKLDLSAAPRSNLVFLLDVSGSMNSPDKLPLLKQSLTLLIHELRPDDRIAIVVYAGAAGTILPSTPISEKNKIIACLDMLSAGGSTAGGAGIMQAYKLAKENFIAAGNNRVILATDGDFNVGVSDESGLVKLIESKRAEKIYLSVLGFGKGNYADSKMEQLANNGNGNFAYIDNLLEAKKVLVKEMGGTLYTIAKDVKLQVEFNPSKVSSYRLLGYENRTLQNEDFKNDAKDAGDLGAGHTVTALYEVVPVGKEMNTTSRIDPLKYQEQGKPINSDELMTVKFRYKTPDSDTSTQLERVVYNTRISNESLRWASSMASFGMLLRDSQYKGTLTWDSLLAFAKANKGIDLDGYRAEAIKMIETAQILLHPKEIVLQPRTNNE